MQGRDRVNGLIRPVLLKAAGRMSSLRITVSILLWIAAMCIAATIVPQHRTSPFTGDIPLMTRLSRMAGFSDIFHSVWLILPSMVLVINSIACMAFWIRGRVGQGHIPAMPRGCCHEEILPQDAGSARMKQDLIAGLSRGYHIRPADHGNAWHAFGEKSRIRALAPALVHAGIIVILCGVALGTLGYEGSIQIPEGSVTEEATLDDGSPVRLPFAVRCNGFEIEYYDNGMPREYRSGLSFIKGGKDVMDRSLTVNHPVSFGGILFAQSGYDRTHTATIGVKAGNAVYHAVAGEETFFDLPQKGYRVHVVKIIENVMNMGPAAELVVDTPGGQKRLWVFKELERFRARFPGVTERMPEIDPSGVRPYTFTLEGNASRSVTILKINRDPGVIPVAIGALLFLVGILTVFLVPRDCIWMTLETPGDHLRLKVVRSHGGRVCEAGGDILKSVESLREGRP